jgi:hypothetical protein
VPHTHWTSHSVPAHALFRSAARVGCAGGRGTATDPKNALNPTHDATRTHTPRLSCTAAPRLTQHAGAQRASGARAPATAGVEPDGSAPASCAARLTAAAFRAAQTATPHAAVPCVARRRRAIDTPSIAAPPSAAPSLFDLRLTRAALRPGQCTGRSTREAPLRWRGIARETSDHAASRELAQHTMR